MEKAPDNPLYSAAFTALMESDDPRVAAVRRKSSADQLLAVMRCIVDAAEKGERERCTGIVSAARFGEVDQDLRSIRSMIESGWSLEKIKNP